MTELLELAVVTLIAVVPLCLGALAGYYNAKGEKAAAVRGFGRRS